MKRVLLSILIILGGSISSLTFAGELTEISGYCGKDGNNIKWTVNTEDKTLVFEGSGEMQDFQYDSQPWKQYKDDVKTVSIKEGVENIGNNTLCNMLFSGISLPSTVEEIGVYAFGYCANLKNIILPSNIKKIGSSAFSGSGLEKIEIPYLIDAINEGVFKNCSNLKEVVIPRNIISIGQEAFAGCSAMSTITLPEYLESIGFNAFASCTNLTAIILPEGLTSIGSNAFNGCTNLTSIILPDRLTSIGSGAFRNTALVKISIPASVSTLEKSTFNSCRDLEDIFFTENTTSIGDDCFSNCTSLKLISLPENLEYVGKYAFSSCTALETINIQGATNLGDYAFNGCTSLVSVVFPEDYEAWHLGNHVFDYCSSLGPLYNSTTLFYMPDDGKETITIPNGITTIAKYAFYGNQSIKNLYLPSTVTYFGSYAFSSSVIEELDLSNLDYVSLGEGVFSYSSISHIISPSKISNCPQSAFDGCKKLTEIDLSGIKESSGWSDQRDIGKYAFRGCENLKLVILPDDRDRLEIGQEAFQNCYALEVFDFSKIGTIYMRAFQNCKSLKKIEISNYGSNNSGSHIWYSAFSGCTGIESVVIGSSGLEWLYLSTFEGCDNLKSVIINSQLIPQIGELFEYPYYGFWENGFSDFNLPYGNTTFTMLGYRADYCLEGSDSEFWNKVHISRIYEDLFGECGDKGDNIKWSLNTKDGILRIVGSGNMKKPENEETLTWQDRNLAVKEIYFSDDIESICPQAFMSLPIKTLKLNKKLKEIGNFAFSGCGMESIEFNDSLKKICEWAFGSCYSLRKVVLNEGLEYLENSVFNMCYNLEELVLPNSLLSLGQAVTGSCSNLKTITLPKKISSIPNYTFSSCNNLRDVYIPSITPPTFGGRNDYNDGLRMNSNVTIHIPQGCAEAYSSAAVWSQHKIDEYYEYISINCNDGGIFVVNNDTIKSGNWDDYLIKDDNLFLKVIPNNYYTVNSLMINGKESVSELNDSVLSFNALNESKNVQILFKPNVYNLSIVNHGSGNTRIWDYIIDDQAKFKIDYSEKADISFIPNNNCILESVIMNGVEIIDQVKENKYYIEKATEDIIIEVFFSNLKGDVNGDGTVNAADIVEVVSYIMGNLSDKYDENGIDANGDGTVNAADIVTIVNIIMEKQKSKNGLAAVRSVSYKQ